MHEAVKEVYGGGGVLRRGIIRREILGEVFSWIVERGVEFGSWTGLVHAPVYWRF
jgi:hypothetical protein